MNSLMKMKKNQKGFTLMEMLIVVAIIAVLVAILIPTVSKSLNKSKEATDIANLRSSYASAQMDFLATPKKNGEKLAFDCPKLNYPATAMKGENSGVDAAGFLKDKCTTAQDAQEITLTDNAQKEPQATAYYYAKETKVTYKIVIGENGCFEKVETTDATGYAIPEAKK